MNSIIIYNSKGGTTKAYAEQIAAYQKQNGIHPEVYSLEDFDMEKVKQADLLFLGSWTNGLFLFYQHPDKKWKEFARKLPELTNKKVVLFTTYKLLTGTMFKKMNKDLGLDMANGFKILKSRSSELTKEDKKILDSLMS